MGFEAPDAVRVFLDHDTVTTQGYHQQQAATPTFSETV